MIARLIPLLALSAFALAPAGSAAPTIQLVVPSFDYTPGQATSTSTAAIANDGTVVGYFSTARIIAEGFVRYADGRFSQPIAYPGATSTTGSGINNSGVVSGSYGGRDGLLHGFFFDGATYTEFDLPGYLDTVVTGENDAGDFVGNADNLQGAGTAFVSIGGVISTFTIPGSLGVSPRAINNLGQVVGVYTVGFSYHGFFRDADGTLTYPIDFPHVRKATGIYGINDQGVMVGQYATSNAYHGFVLQAGRFTGYDYPGATDTVFTGINNSNTISGSYVGAAGSGYHGFIARFGR